MKNEQVITCRPLVLSRAARTAILHLFRHLKGEMSDLTTVLLGERGQPTHIPRLTLFFHTQENAHQLVSIIYNYIFFMIQYEKE